MRLTSYCTEPSGTERPNLPFLPPGLGQDDERGHEFQAYKAAFFFKLDRELEKAGYSSIPMQMGQR